MCGRARRAPRAERESVTSLRQGPRSPPAITSSRKPDPKTRVQSASPRALRRRSTNHIETQESSDKSPHTHTYSYNMHMRHGRVHGCRICHPQKHYSHDTRAPGRAAAAAAAAHAGGQIRTGRSSDRLGGRCSVCQSALSAQRAPSGAGKRGGAGTRGGGGEQASGPRAARRTGDRQAGDGPESDRAQRSEASRSSLGRS